jgi:hypothetical protein
MRVVFSIGVVVVRTEALKEDTPGQAANKTLFLSPTSLQVGVEGDIAALWEPLSNAIGHLQGETGVITQGGE